MTPFDSKRVETLKFSSLVSRNYKNESDNTSIEKSIYPFIIEQCRKRIDRRDKNLCLSSDFVTLIDEGRCSRYKPPPCLFL